MSETVKSKLLRSGIGRLIYLSQKELKTALGKIHHILLIDLL